MSQVFNTETSKRERTQYPWELPPEPWEEHTGDSLSPPCPPQDDDVDNLTEGEIIQAQEAVDYLLSYDGIFHEDPLGDPQISAEIQDQMARMG